MAGEEVKDRSPIEKVVLVMVLPAVAGAVNASGLFVVGSYTSHVTGTIARIGDEVAQSHWDAVRACLWMIVFFLLGAMAATVLVDRAQRLARAKYAPALCVEAALLGFIAFGAAVFPRGTDPYTFVLTLALCTAMGMQNALVTRISGAVVRTTHMTGVLTDMGIELVHVGLFLRQRMFALVGKEAERPVTLDLQRLMFHATILTSFSMGAMVGPISYLSVGALSLVMPCLVLLALAYIDARIGLRISEGQARSWRETSKARGPGLAPVPPVPPVPTNVSGPTLEVVVNRDADEPTLAPKGAEDGEEADSDEETTPTVALVDGKRRA